MGECSENLFSMKVLITQPRGKEKLVEEFTKQGAELVQKFDESVKLIVPTVDEELWFFSRSNLPVMCSSPYTVDLCRDKAEFYRFCKRHGFQTPITMQDNLIVKPRFGKGSRGIIKLDRSYIVQEDLSVFPEVSIDYFADWQGKCLSLIPRFRLNIENGESKSYSLVPKFDDTEVRRLGEELGLVGHNVIQGFLVDNKQMIFIEVNPRFGGGSWMTFNIFNSVKWLLENPK